MDIRFIRSNGDTAHNDPKTPDFVPGEPPQGPTTAFDYRHKCLAEGFARIGWPNTGDLRAAGAGRLASQGYSFATLGEETQRYLTEFVAICTGDLVLLPARDADQDVHLGLLFVAPDRAVRSWVSGPESLPITSFTTCRAANGTNARTVSMCCGISQSPNHQLSTGFRISEAFGPRRSASFSKLAGRYSRLLERLGLQFLRNRKGAPAVASTRRISAPSHVGWSSFLGCAPPAGYAERGGDD